MLFPPAVEDLIPVNHPVRLLNKIIDSLKLDYVYRQYVGDGAPA